MSRLLLFLISANLLLEISAVGLESDRSSLLLFRQSVGPHLPFNTSSNPCSWRGVTCRSGRVWALRLPGSYLSGSIPAGTIGNLTALHTLSLRLNSLTGALPSDFGNLTGLRNVYLQGNRFTQTGPLPPNLVRLNFAGNNLSGLIPEQLSNLTRLGVLLLERNNFSGEIPSGFGNLGSLTQFNVSYNNLTGPIPVGLRRMGRDCFLGMRGLCGEPLGPCPDGISPALSPGSHIVPIPVGPPANRGRKLSGGAIAGIAVGSALAVLVVLALLIFCCRSKEERSKSRSAEASSVPKANGAGAAAASSGATAAAAAPAAGRAVVSGKSERKRLVFVGGKQGPFDLEDLLRASAEVLGKGTFGTAYKAVLEGGSVVAVKRLRDVILGENEFRERVESVGAMEHRNLVKLQAYYYSKDEKLLVYDYMAMGSLSSHLHANKGSGPAPLDWKTRARIALAAARGIAYIHSSSHDASHGNIKSSNVLLDEANDACLSDYGLAHLVSSSANPPRAAGYRAPEVTDSHKISQKADVYSFGVLLLELVTGRAPAQAVLNEEGVDLPRWVQSVVRNEGRSKAFDPELLGYQNVEDEMAQMLQLGIDCTAQYPDMRPLMSEILTRIEGTCRSNPEDRNQDQHLGEHPDIDNDHN